MSHFTVLVIGPNPEKQLAPYSERIEVPEYVREVVSDEDRISFMEHYSPGNVRFPEDFEALYAKKGRDWNSSSWRKHSDGTWHDYSTYNPRSKWDWYLLGGRWTGFFKLKKKLYLGTSQVFFNELGFSQGEVENLINMCLTDKPKFKKVIAKYNGKSKQVEKAIDDEILFRNQDAYPEHKLGEPGLMTEVAKVGTADQVLKRDIDFEGMRKEAVEKARKRYRKALKIIGHLPENKSWDQVFKDFDVKERGTVRDEAVAFYWGQPRCKLAREGKESFELFWDGPDEYLVSEEEYLQKAKESAISTFALVKDGEWYEKGKMGWFGISIDEKDQSTWNKQFSDLLDSIPDDTLLSLYDCHI